MYCRECGEKNPEEAVFCRNCGKKLKEDVKKAKVMENTSNNYQKTSEATSTSSTSGNSNDDWKCCCGCLLAIFIIFALASIF